MRQIVEYPTVPVTWMEYLSKNVNPVNYGGNGLEAILKGTATYDFLRKIVVPVP